MAALKERFQNPTVGDTVRLRLFTYNSNNLANVNSIQKIDIYYLDPVLRAVDNPDGRRLVESLSNTGIVSEDVGVNYIDLNLPTPQYVIGNYLDIWSFFIDDGLSGPPLTVENRFQIYPELWYTTPIPVVYDFNFYFQPNKLRQGSKQYLRIEIIPNVPRASELQDYYTNLAIAANLSISIERQCGNCLPEEEDLRLEVDQEPISFREKRFAYYQFDTSELDCGVYNVWFTMEFGGNTYISDKMPLMIYS